ncbi:MAG: 3-isopropylmalate dehydrogenase [Acidobacteria bacterium RIFCSPLOWO2_02_FULL_61_28]|nr:MAG: 3-isopropylmalate dehydrogenase [Acidobacteria bacterium RIFCSPLOWO2_02_FULL_61_28]
MNLNIALLPGDGIGPEVTAQGVAILEAVCRKFSHSLEVKSGLIGGVAIRSTGDPLPADTVTLIKSAAAVLLGACGHPEFDSHPPEKRPEKGLLRLRQELRVFANLRPAFCYPALESLSPLRAEVVRGTDLVTVRELTGGMYYGTPRGIQERDGEVTAINTMVYTKKEIERIARVAFGLARGRKNHVMSVDKSNVLENSQLWRKTVTELAAREFPDVRLEHMLVDTCAMQLVQNPRRFDVLVTENLFGDILSDETAVLTGSIGMLPSASLGEHTGLYEPVHGSAPDIAGKGIANPLGTILSVAMMLRHSFGLEKEAKAVEDAVGKTVESGKLTRDLNGTATTEEVGNAVIHAL